MKYVSCVRIQNTLKVLVCAYMQNIAGCVAMPMFYLTLRR